MNPSFDKDIEEAIFSFPKLDVGLKDKEKILFGELDIVDGEAKIWDTYEIEIKGTEKYPYRFPMLFEMGGKIPRIPDWHVYSDSGSCCVDVPPSEIIICKKGLNVKDFITKHAIPYLANQTYRRIEGYYKNGEYSHGPLGLIEYYLPKMRTSNVKQALKWMYEISEGKHLTRSIFHPCFCGSGLKLGNCHKEATCLLKQIGSDEVKLHLHIMMDYYKRIS